MINPKASSEYSTQRSRSPVIRPDVSELRKATTGCFPSRLHYSNPNMPGPCSSVSSRIRPPPRATQVSGSSAITTGRPVSSMSILSTPHTTTRPPDAFEGFLKRLQYFIRVQGEAPRHAFGQVAALDRNFPHRLPRVGRADFQLYPFRSSFTDQYAVVAPHVVGDGLVEFVAADAHARRVHDAVQGDYPPLGGAAADVQHHRAARLLNRQTRTDRGGHGLGDDIHAAGAGPFRRFLDGAPFHLGGTEGHAHQNSGAGAQEPIAVHLFDEVLQHLFRVGEIRNDPVLHGPDGRDMAWGASQHVFGFDPDRDDDLAAPGGFVLHCDDRWFIEHNAALTHVNQRVGRSKID